ncbi:MAG: hypothetical protein JWP63_1976 [Candidatus Solibacter sp.]|jgi:hypothetical protein|nr:hypothetical protein [Candidatus Solibacter sp.]
MHSQMTIGRKLTRGGPMQASPATRREVDFTPSAGTLAIVPGSPSPHR